ncbi:MAG: isoprenylcysteine carboxyl methyltransferase [Pseudonocardiales bacterium]|nr:isoprenylcysteine carboxylmethyltransferase family protein [Actinomycetota bacterium]PZS24416.1 MAG: isoprenylcysteine carboxyl methyltransferase [Pseudonocardiales bacterium]
MAALALSLGLFYLLVVFLVQPVLLRRHTGRSAWLASLGATRWEQTANLLFLLGCGLDLTNPALVLAGVMHPVVLPGQHITVTLTASVVFIASLALAVISQWVMGEAWRTGIDPQHPTSLITSGPFRLVRNPTYTSLLACSLAIGLLVPTVLAAAGVLTCLAALQIQTRLIEEPHLRQVHGQAYQRYAAQAGRFVPAVGRLPG